MSQNASPVVQRRRLRLELKQARQEVGLTQEMVAEQMDWSLSKIIRIETGSVGVSRNDLIALLHLYGVNDPQRFTALVAQGKEARRQTWWSKYRPDLPTAYFQYIEYETSASIILSYEPFIVPDLLQTEGYASVAAKVHRPNLSPSKIWISVELQMKRQELLLSRADPPLLFFVLDEAVIHRLIGTKELRQAQLEKLIRMADRPEITIEIVPFSIGLHHGITENFRILEFGGITDNVLYFDSARGSIFSHDGTGDLTIYRDLFQNLREMSLGPKESLTYLRKIAQDIE